MAHNVLSPQVESRLACNSCIVQLFHFGLCFPLGQVLAINLSSAAAFHPSDSTWLDWVSSLGCRGWGELFNLCASDQFACRQTNFVMQSQAVHLLLSRLERLTYVNDKSKGGGNWNRPQCGIQDGAQDGDVCSICSKDRLRERAEENLNQAHA